MTIVTFCVTLMLHKREFGLVLFREVKKEMITRLVIARPSLMKLGLPPHLRTLMGGAESALFLSFIAENRRASPY